MSQSEIHLNMTGVRSAGSKDPITGKEHGGVYFPAHIKNGRQVNAKFQVTLFANLGNYTDRNGNVVEKTRPYQLVAWNSNNSLPGRGLADLMAKCISSGKELHPTFSDIEVYEKRKMVNGQPVIDQQGNAITYEAHSYRLARFPSLGADSAKHVANEVASWNGVISFDGRPPAWNQPGTADAQAWAQIMAARNTAVYDGQSPTFGFARVIIPEGAQLVQPAGVTQPPVQPTVQQPPVQPTVQQPPVQPTVQQPPVQPVHSAVVVQPVQQELTQPAMGIPPTTAAVMVTTPV